MTSSDSTGSKVRVSGLSTATTEAHLTSFFSFCGKIVSIAQEGDSAEIVFAKPSAAKTALFLDGGHLDGNEIKVTSDDVETPSIANAKPVDAPTHAEKEGHDIEQEDKPHSAKLAEYLAHGYTIGDQAISKAIEADKSYGISQRFLSFFNLAKEKAQPHVDRVAAKAAEVDEKQGLTLKGKAAMIIGSKYYNAALASPVGSKVYSFYTTAAKNVTDVHEEALRIKASRSDAPSSPSGPVNPASGSTSTSLPHDAPLPSTGTVASTDAASEKPLESTAAPLKG
ncbi:hypothetical protein JCM8547_007589 [Rhodosporidiobolus lusitaniae]